jgi:hypothetical protein
MKVLSIAEIEAVSGGGSLIGDLFHAWGKISAQSMRIIMDNGGYAL